MEDNAKDKAYVEIKSFVDGKGKTRYPNGKLYYYIESETFK